MSRSAGRSGCRSGACHCHDRTEATVCQETPRPRTRRAWCEPSPAPLADARSGSGAGRAVRVGRPISVRAPAPVERSRDGVNRLRALGHHHRALGQGDLDGGSGGDGHRGVREVRVDHHVLIEEDAQAGDRSQERGGHDDAPALRRGGDGQAFRADQDVDRRAGGVAGRARPRPPRPRCGCRPPNRGG